MIILHEYFRNLYPYDTHIKFNISNPKKRINLLQKNLIKILKDFNNFGFYKIDFNNNISNEELKKNWKSLW